MFLGSQRGDLEAKDGSHGDNQNPHPNTRALQVEGGVEPPVARDQSHGQQDCERYKRAAAPLRYALGDGTGRTAPAVPSAVTGGTGAALARALAGSRATGPSGALLPIDHRINGNGSVMGIR